MRTFNLLTAFIMSKVLNQPQDTSDILGRSIGLDLFRSIAYISVFIGHSLDIFRRTAPSLSKIFFLFKDAVEIFFVVSGFLIGIRFLASISADGVVTKNSILGFYKKRWFKTLPSYYLVLLAHIFIGLFFYPDLLKDFNWRFFFFLQNLRIADFYFFPVSYSLAIEEWFYLLFPFFILLLFKLPIRLPAHQRIALYVFGIIIVATGIRLLHFYFNNPHWDAVLRKSIICRLDAPVYGVGAAWFFLFYKELFDRYSRPLFFAGFVIFFTLIFTRKMLPDNVLSSVFYFNLVPLSFACMIPFFYSLKINNRRFSEILIYMSLTSYSFYLIHHTPILFTMLHFLPPQSVGQSILLWVLFSGLVFICTHLLYTYYERPIMKLQDKIKMFSV